MEPKVTGVVLLAAVLVRRDAVPQEYREHCKSWEENKDASVLLLVV